MVRAMDRHERERSPDGTSAIDPMRSHLNDVLHGPKAGPSAALERFYEAGVQKPTRQAESPYLQIVVSASASFFRPDDPDARGTWDADRLEAWRRRAEAWLREEFGNDLVHAAIHLDEDTPHIHALVAPTYQKKPRTPGRRKKNETEEEFQTRRQAAIDAPSVRTVGRASHSDLSKKGSFQRLRERAAIAFHDLGIGYGEDRRPEAPDGISTREWVAREAVRLRQDQVALDAERTKLRSWSEDLAAERDKINAEKTRLNELRDQLTAAHDAAKKLLADVREAMHLPRDARTTLRESIKDLRAALKPPPKGNPDPDPDPGSVGSASQIAHMIRSQSQSPDSDGPDIEM